MKQEAVFSIVMHSFSNSAQSHPRVPWQTPRIFHVSWENTVGHLENALSAIHNLKIRLHYILSAIPYVCQSGCRVVVVTVIKSQHYTKTNVELEMGGTVQFESKI